MTASYAKGPKTIQDFGLGYQSVNRAIDNEQALADAYTAEHYIGNASSGPINFGNGVQLIPLGRHDSVLIPRILIGARVSPITYYPGSTLPQYWVELLSSVGTLFAVSLTRQATGVYFLSLGGVDATTTWVEGTAVGDDTLSRFVSTRFNAQQNGAPATGALIRTFQRNSSTTKFELSDFDFSLAVFSK